MNNTDLNFSGQQADEVIVAFSRHHWFLVLPYFIGLLLVLVLMALPFVQPVQEWLLKVLPIEMYMLFTIPMMLIFTVYLHRNFVQIFNYYLKVIIVTNYRVIDLDKSLILSDMRDALDLSKIQDVILHKDGIMQSIFNYGEIVITLPAVNMIKRIRFVPMPSLFYHKINDMRLRFVSNIADLSSESDADGGRLNRPTILQNQSGLRMVVS